MYRTCLFPYLYTFQITHSRLPRLHYLSILRLCNSSPSFFFNATDLVPNPNRLRIVFLDALSSSSNFTSSKGASTVLFSSTFGTIDMRNRLARDEIDGFRVLILESKLNLGVLANVGDEMIVGEVPPISNDRLLKAHSRPLSIYPIEYRSGKYHSLPWQT